MTNFLQVVDLMFSQDATGGSLVLVASSDQHRGALRAVPCRVASPDQCLACKADAYALAVPTPG